MDILVVVRVSVRDPYDYVHTYGSPGTGLAYFMVQIYNGNLVEAIVYALTSDVRVVVGRSTVYYSCAYNIFVVVLLQLQLYY